MLFNRNSTNWTKKKNFVRAFSLAELLIGLLLTTILMAGIFRFFVNFSRTSSETAKTAKITLDSQKILKKLSTELGNAVVIPIGSGTVLSNNSPSSTACSVGPIVHSLIPYPGHSYSDVNSRINFTPIDPSNSSLVSEIELAKMNDAIRVVFLKEDSEAILLAPNPLGDGQITVQGTQNIVISGSDSNKIHIGDYILISDSTNSDLARVTSIGQVDGNIALGHSNSVSIWNKDTGFEHTYGAADDFTSPAFIQKVGIKTYAYHPQDRKLLMDDHQQDDGFSPQTQTFIGSTGLKYGWVPAATGISKFKIYYLAMDLNPNNLQELIEIATRTPRAAPTGKGSLTATEVQQLQAQSLPVVNCSNQLGNPDLNRVKIVMTDEKGEVEWEIIPENLRRGLSSTGGGENLDRDPVYISATPTPTPTITWTSGGSTPTATPTATSTPASPVYGWTGTGGF